MRTARALAPWTLLAACLASTGAAFPADATPPPTVQTLLQRLAEARGGPERRMKVRTITIEGTWTAFSTDVPMTIRRARPDLYRFDHSVLGTPAVVAFDGEHAWVQGEAFGAPAGQQLDDDWKRNIIDDAPFGPKLLELAAHGARITLVGSERDEGRDNWVLEVAATEGHPAETWYLDAETGLESKRISHVFDIFSGPGVDLEMETYYMDFRDVEGVKLPFREERHFGTRYNVFEARTVRLDAQIDPAVFRVPPAPETEGGGESNPTESSGS